MTRSASIVKPKVNYTVDVRGAISPFSLLKVSLVFQQMRPSEVVEVLGCDMDMKQDLLRLLPDASYEMIEGSDGGDREAIPRVFFRKESGAPGNGRS
jgi:TusA-related sulfurtransferase